MTNYYMTWNYRLFDPIDKVLFMTEKLVAIIWIMALGLNDRISVWRNQEKSLSSIYYNIPNYCFCALTYILFSNLGQNIKHFPFSGEWKMCVFSLSNPIHQLFEWLIISTNLNWLNQSVNELPQSLQLNKC